MAGINHRYKLYISPAPEDLVTALGGLVETLLRQGPTVFKVGADLHGMLRPDKLVVYFTTRERLFSVARNLGERIGSCRPHGVPFTAELEGEGLISWAVDPPSESVRSLWDPRRHSWRSWLALELASGFAATVGTRDRDIEAQAFALDRLERLGVDTSTWTLACAPWRDEVSPSGNQL